MNLLSVIVTLTGGEDQVARCLRALTAQHDAPPMEILVPLYPALHDGTGLRRAWPVVRWIDMPDDPPPPVPAFEHWKVDRLRAAGLAAASGDVIALIQDNALPGDSWCAALWEEHRNKPYEVIGGGIRNVGASLLNRAVFYCDFGRFQPPFPPAATGYASVVNVSYKRAAIENCRDAWQEFYDESVVHRRILDAGGAVYLTPAFHVDYDRGPLSVGIALRQKLASGRAFAARRAQASSLLRRLVLAAFSPGLAPLMLARQFLLLRRRGSELTPFLAAAPLTWLCLLAWSIGEFIGYVTARPFPKRSRGH